MPKTTKLVRLGADSYNTASHLEEGWTLSQVVQAQKLITHDQSHGVYGNEQHHVFQGLASDPIFVFERDFDADEHDKAQRAEIEEMKAELATVNKKLDEATDRAHALAVAIENFKTRNEVLEKQLADATNKNQTLETDAKRITTDVAKIRREVGEGRWRALGLEIDSMDQPTGEKS